METYILLGAFYAILFIFLFFFIRWRDRLRDEQRAQILKNKQNRRDTVMCRIIMESKC